MKGGRVEVLARDRLFSNLSQSTFWFSYLIGLVRAKLAFSSLCALTSGACLICGVAKTCFRSGNSKWTPESQSQPKQSVYLTYCGKTKISMPGQIPLVWKLLVNMVPSQKGNHPPWENTLLKNPLAFGSLEPVGQHIWPRIQPGTTGLCLLEDLSSLLARCFGHLCKVYSTATGGKASFPPLLKSVSTSFSLCSKSFPCC